MSFCVWNVRTVVVEEDKGGIYTISTAGHKPGTELPQMLEKHIFLTAKHTTTHSGPKYHQHGLRYCTRVFATNPSRSFEALARSHGRGGKPDLDGGSGRKPRTARVPFLFTDRSFIPSWPQYKWYQLTIKKRP